ncbi:RNAse H family protein [Bacillus sp. WMMC1349]|uniref:ribonuclease H1 domain-containing protein n=1 Tax=Bacillus sp. WMMC1349 TaxID=2736254 RepID=UPI00155748EE|nr:ribonuclease H family protein [Bacillus sp. WMMC1349]NPC91239.1 RNAse H family protein [Bacillus sp. WMMC1349]
MAKRFYVVRRGHETGVFTTWDECMKAVSCYSKPEFKSFASMEEAQIFLDECDEKEKTQPKPTAKVEKENTVVTYIGGSYKKQPKKYSYGLLLILPDGKQIKGFGSDNEEEALASHTVAGKLLGTVVAIDKAIELKFKNIYIIHDYEGITKWANGEWKTVSFVAKQYKEFIDKKKEKINITFELDKGYSNNEYINVVDALAKKALNIM